MWSRGWPRSPSTDGSFDGDAGTRSCMGSVRALSPRFRWVVTMQLPAGRICITEVLRRGGLARRGQRAVVPATLPLLDVPGSGRYIGPSIRVHPRSSPPPRRGTSSRGPQERPRLGAKHQSKGPHKPMPPLQRSLVAVLLATSLQGCFSWRVQHVPPAQVFENDPPAQVRITRTDQSQITLSNPRISGDSVVGSVENGPAGVPLTDVASLAVRKSDGVATFGLAALVLAGGVVAIAAAACCGN